MFNLIYLQICEKVVFTLEFLEICKKIKFRLLI